MTTTQSSSARLTTDPGLYTDSIPYPPMGFAPSLGVSKTTSNIYVIAVGLYGFTPPILGTLWDDDPSRCLTRALTHVASAEGDDPIERDHASILQKLLAGEQHDEYDDGGCFLHMTTVTMNSSTTRSIGDDAVVTASLVFEAPASSIATAVPRT